LSRASGSTARGVRSHALGFSKEKGTPPKFGRKPKGEKSGSRRVLGTNGERKWCNVVFGRNEGKKNQRGNGGNEGKNIQTQ